MIWWSLVCGPPRLIPCHSNGIVFFFSFFMFIPQQPLCMAWKRQHDCYQLAAHWTGASKQGEQNLYQGECKSPMTEYPHRICCMQAGIEARKHIQWSSE